MADVLIGRFPVNTPDEARAMVSKALAYHQNTTTSDDHRRLLFVADNPDTSGNYHAISDEVSTAVPTGYAVDKVYLQNVQDDAARVRQRIDEELSRGSLIVNFLGHASITGWTHEEVFGAEKAASLTAADGPLPLLLSMTCLDGVFSFPGRPSTSEAMVKNGTGGAIASFSASGPAVATGHAILNRGFLDAALMEDVGQIGASAFLAKVYLFRTTDNYRDLLDTFTLLGDPGVVLGTGRG